MNRIQLKKKSKRQLLYKFPERNKIFL